MKRSEMIKILEDTFSRFEDPSSIAERALSAVENAGMVPPDRSYCHCEDCGSGPDHSWEDEPVEDDKEWRNRYGKHD